MGPYLQIQNYMDIGKIDVAEQNSSTRKLPRPGLRGGGRGGVPLCGARDFAIGTKSKAKYNKDVKIHRCGFSFTFRKAEHIASAKADI